MSAPLIEIRSPSRVFRMDVSAGLLRDADGNRVALTKGQWNILTYLADNHDRLVSKDDLQKAVWRREAVNDETISQAIRALRRALKDSTGSPEFIETAWGKGYRLIAEVSAASTVAPPEGGGTPLCEKTVRKWTPSCPRDFPGLVELEIELPPDEALHELEVFASIRFGLATAPWKGRMISIGLQSANLSVKSETYRIVHNSMIGDRVPRNTLRRGAGRDVEILGPTDEQGNLTGDPIGSAPIAEVAYRGSGTPSLSLMIAAADWSFDIAKVDQKGRRSATRISAEKLAILSAIVREGRPIDGQGRVVIAEAQMQRKDAE